MEFKTQYLAVIWRAAIGSLNRVRLSQQLSRLPSSVKNRLTAQFWAHSDCTLCLESGRVHCVHEVGESIVYCAMYSVHEHILSVDTKVGWFWARTITFSTKVWFILCIWYFKEFVKILKTFLTSFFCVSLLQFKGSVQQDCWPSVYFINWTQLNSGWTYCLFLLSYLNFVTSLSGWV